MIRKFARPRTVPVLGSAALLALAAQAALADVTLKEKMTIEGQGLMSMAGMTGTSTTTVQGDRARIETDAQMNSRLVRVFARGMGPTAQIIRLEEDKVYQLDLKKKEYTEQTFAEARAQMEKVAQQMQQAQGQQAGSPIDESECEWSEPRAEVKRSGEKASFAGFQAERATVSVLQSCKSRKTGQVCDVGILIDQWLAPGVAGSEELTKFFEGYSRRMGFAAAGSRDFAQRAEQHFGRYKTAWAEASKKLKELKGYPVKMSFGLGFGGPQCQAADASTQQAGAPGSAGEAAATGVGGAAGEAAGRSAGGSIGGIAGQIGGRIAGSIFNRNRKKQEEAAQAEAEAQGEAVPAAATAALTPEGMFVPLRITNELISVNRAPAPGDAFEVPADFKKARE